MLNRLTLCLALLFSITPFTFANGQTSSDTTSLPREWERKDTLVNGVKKEAVFFSGQWWIVTESDPPLKRATPPSEETTSYGPLAPTVTTADSLQQVELNAAVVSSSPLEIAHESRTADLRFYGTKALSGYDYGKNFWAGGGGIGLGINVKNHWRLGFDCVVRSSPNSRGSTAFPISLAHSPSIGKKLSASFGGYAGPTASSNPNDKFVAGLTTKIGFYIPNNSPNELPGAFEFFAEPYFESGGRFGLKIGVAKVQSH